MKELKPFDPIVVAETQKRLRNEQDRLNRADRAATALLWFNEYAWEKPNAISVLGTVVASSTPNAGAAEQYVKRAATTFADQILAAAIELAKEDLRDADPPRR